jgi:hypothetical protein
MGEPKVAREVAERDFERMCRSRRVVTDPAEIDEDDLPGLTAVREKLVKAIMRGELVIEENGDPVYTPPVGGAKSLRFHKPTGATYMAMEANRPGEADGQVARTVRALTEMTRSDKGEIARLEGADYQMCVTLGQLFLASR